MQRGSVDSIPSWELYSRTLCSLLARRFPAPLRLNLNYVLGHILKTQTSWFNLQRDFCRDGR
jgi:hypothetical protein